MSRWLTTATPPDARQAESSFMPEGFQNTALRCRGAFSPRKMVPQKWRKIGETIGKQLVPATFGFRLAWIPS
jgi:hypothetical protein